MEIKLPVYEKKQIVKTYTAEAYNVMFGTVEDLVGVIDFEKFTTGKDADLIKGVAMAIPKAFGFIKPLLKDIFDGLTDDEIKHCRVTDIAKVIIAVVKFTTGQIVEGSDSKN